MKNKLNQRLILILIIICIFKPGYELGAKIINFVVITTADIQSHILPYEAKIEDKTMTIGGLDRIASAAKKIKGEVDGAIFLSSGDDLLGTIFYMFKGEPEMRAMSFAGYDVITPGNHEFDYGVNTYKNALDFFNGSVVCANLSFSDPQLQKKIKPYVINKIAGVKVGIFGLMTPDFPRLCMLNENEVTINKDFIAVSKKMVNQLIEKKCQIIIALTHLGIEKDRQLANNVDGIDFIVGGHSHSYEYEYVNRTIIVQAGVGGQKLGVLRFSFHNGKIISPHWELITLDEKVGYDQEIRNLLLPYWNEYQEALNKPVGETLVDLDARKITVRKRESNVGNLIADAWLDWFKEADIALVNGGSIRGDRIYPKGELTYMDVDELQMFKNEIYMVELSGEMIKQILEISVSSVEPDPNLLRIGQVANEGGFLQVGGIRFSVDLSAEHFVAIYNDRQLAQLVVPGARVYDIKVKQGEEWQPLEENKIYKVLIPSAMAEGIDGYYIFLSDKLKKENTTVKTNDVLARYIRDHSPVSPQIEDRIVFKER